MDPVMLSLFGKMPISQLASVQAAAIQKNNANTILIMGAIIVIAAVIIINMDKNNKELRMRLYELNKKTKENF